MKTVFALAVGENEEFGNVHFGDADNYLLYELIDKKLKFKKKLYNVHKNYAEGNHGLGNKGEVISSFLKEEGVNVIVTKQFGKNIKIVSKSFIPVVVYFDSKDSFINNVNPIIPKIKKELLKKDENYSLIKMKL